MVCPRCQKELKPSTSGYVEVGEWSGKSYEIYEIEGNADGYECENCRLRVFIMK